MKHEQAFVAGFFDELRKLGQNYPGMKPTGAIQAGVGQAGTPPVANRRVDGPGRGIASIALPNSSGSNAGM